MYRLGLLWLFGLGRRSPGARKVLLGGSLGVSILSLGLSLAALGVTRALVAGFETVLSRALSQTQGDVLHHFGDWFDPNEEIQLIQNLPMPEAIKRTEFYWTTQGLVVGNSAGRGVLIEGRHSRSVSGDLAPSDFFSVTSTNPSEMPSVVLGKALADVLGAKAGDSVKILLPGILKSSIPARVSALIEPGMYELESRFVLIDDLSLVEWLKKHSPESLKNRPGESHGVRYFANPDFQGIRGEDNLQKWIQEYKTHLEDPNSMLPLGVSRRVQSWREMRSNLFQGIVYNKRELTLILSFLNLVAALNIAATLVVLFLERDKEIAILNTLGLSQNSLWGFVVFLGMILGILSSILGLVLAPILALGLGQVPWFRLPPEIYNLNHVPFEFLGRDLAFIIFLGVGVAVIIAALLGYKLSRMKFSTVLGNRRS